MHNKKKTSDSVIVIVGIGILIFLIVGFFLLPNTPKSNLETYKPSGVQTNGVDCTQLAWKDNQLCNGELDEQQYQEDNYYQNTVR